MKKKVLFSVAAVLLLLSNCMTVFADSQEKDYSVETPAADEPSPYEDAMLEPYRFNNLIPVFQERPYFYAETSAPGRRNPVRAVGTHSYGESYEVTNVDYGACKFFEYDAQGNLVTVNEFLSDGSPFGTNQYTYDTQGNLLSDTCISHWSGGLSAMQYTYDTQGRLLSETSSYGTDICYSKTYTYNARGNVLAYTYTDSDVTNKDTYTRDARGNVLTHTFNGGKEQHTLNYDAQGNLLIDYIIAGYSDPESWSQAQYTYDEMGNVLTYDYLIYNEGGPNYTNQFTYDAMGNVLTHIYYDGFYDYIETNQFIYDETGNLLTHACELTPRSYSLIVEPFSSIEQYTYDEMGNLLTYTYDAERSYRKLETVSKQYTYDEMGNLLTYTCTNISHISTAYHEPGYIEIEKWQYFYEQSFL